MNKEKLLKVFKELFPNCKQSEQFVNAFLKEFPKHNINTLQRIAMFIAQCGHESAYFTTLKENLNYSGEALLRVFPKYFKDRKVEDYARQPEKIANVVYANRMGNGSETSGDGWKYRGRGIIQLTGKQNYTMCSKFINQDLVNNPDLVSDNPEIAVKSALWFWTKNNLNALQDIKAVTKRINGGLNGLKEREELYAKCLDSLK